MPDDSSDDKGSNKAKEIIDLSTIDPTLQKEIHLLNSAIDEMGLNSYTWRLFMLNWFGYAVDSLIIVVQVIVSLQSSKRVATRYSGLFPSILDACGIRWYACWCAFLRFVGRHYRTQGCF